MITGVETAGLVLASFPLIISALEHYREGFEPIKDWWRFRTDFISFIHVISGQSLLFDENLEELLSPIIRSDAEMNVLLQDPMGQAWQDSHLEEDLRARLPKSFELYKHIIMDIKACMDKLQKKLDMQNGKIAWVDNYNGGPASRLRWEYEFRRIKHVLSKKSRDRLVKNLTTKNEELQKLFTSSERLATNRSQRKAPNAFKRIRDQACGLYSALEWAWKCQCSDSTPPHQANLLLERRHDSQGRKAKRKLKGSSEEQLTVLFLLKTEARGSSLAWHETEIRLLEADGHMTIANVPKPKVASRYAPTDSADGSVANVLEHPTLLIRSKRVAFPAVTVPPPPQSIDSSPSALIEIADLCSAVQRAHHEQTTDRAPLGYLLDTQHRQHALYPSNRPTIFAQDGEKVTLGYLLSQNNKPRAPNASRARLSRLERYSIAATLASSLLQLYSSPWIEETWSKNEIYFIKASEGSESPVIVDKPYISRDFKSSLDPTSITSARNTTRLDNSTKSIEALGIMLLELCFGEAIEDQPFRAKYLGNDGQPNDMTNFCTAKQWWQDYSLGEGGEEFHVAIRRCLFCAFAPKSTSLRDDDLCAALYSEVVEPLESAAQHFVLKTWE